MRQAARVRVGRETRLTLDFCAAYGVASDIELMPIDRIKEAYERMVRGSARYRFVIDIARLKCQG